MLGFATGGATSIPIEVSIGCVVVGIALPRRLSSLHARRTPAAGDPALAPEDPDLPRSASLGGFLFRSAIGAIPFLLPLMLQLGFGLNPLQSGSLTFIAAVGRDVHEDARPAGPAALRLPPAPHRGTPSSARAFLAANGLFTPATPHWLIMLVLFVGGCFRSLQFTSLNAIAYADVSNRDMSYATSLSSVVAAAFAQHRGGARRLRARDDRQPRQARREPRRGRFRARLLARSPSSAPVGLRLRPARPGRRRRDVGSPGREGTAARPREWAPAADAAELGAHCAPR